MAFMIVVVVFLLLMGCSSPNGKVDEKVIAPAEEKTNQASDKIKSDSIVAGESGEPQEDFIRKSSRMGNMCSSLGECFVFCKNNVGRCANFCRSNPKHGFCIVPSPSKPKQWVKDVITQPLPEGASKIRLSLPAPLSKIGLSITGAYGAHRGGHLEGLDHEWIHVEKGTPIGSWADGEVVYARLNSESNPEGGYRIVIYYGDGLWGDHAHVKQVLVKEGDFVKAGDPVAIGEDVAYPKYHFAEFSVADQHRQDGVIYWYKFVKGATLVSPFDYLKDDVKQELAEKWQKEILDEHLSTGKEASGITAPPWEPYLTNPLLRHRENPGKLVGEWYLRSSKWGGSDIPSILIFFPADIKYYPRQRVLGGQDPGDTSDTGSYKTIIDGDWEADYGKGTVIFYTGHGTYYGILEIDESQPQAMLKIEYQQGSYPKNFTVKAIVYTERDIVSKGEELHYWAHHEDDPRNW